MNLSNGVRRLEYRFGGQGLSERYICGLSSLSQQMNKSIPCPAWHILLIVIEYSDHSSLFPFLSVNTTDDAKLLDLLTRDIFSTSLRRPFSYM